MRFLRTDLGWLRTDARIEVTLSAAANVRLLDAENALLHQLGVPYVFVGGLATRSPITLGVPEDDHWFVVVDLESLVGTVSATVRVLSTERSLVSL